MRGRRDLLDLQVKGRSCGSFLCIRGLILCILLRSHFPLQLVIARHYVLTAKGHPFIYPFTHEMESVAKLLKAAADPWDVLKEMTPWDGEVSCTLFLCKSSFRAVMDDRLSRLKGDELWPTPLWNNRYVACVAKRVFTNHETCNIALRGRCTLELAATVLDEMHRRKFPTMDKLSTYHVFLKEIGTCPTRCFLPSALHVIPHHLVRG